MMMKILPAMGALLHLPLKFIPLAQEPLCDAPETREGWPGLGCPQHGGQLRDF